MTTNTHKLMHDDDDSKPAALRVAVPNKNASEQQGRGGTHTTSSPAAERQQKALPFFPSASFRRDENDRLASNAEASPPLLKTAPSTAILKTPPPPAFRRNTTRGPLKKRATSPTPHGRAHRERASMPSPVPPPPRSLAVQSSLHSMPSAPLLRQSSSTFSVYPHHQHLPPQLCLTSSCGRQLMLEPLLATPNHYGMTPRSAFHTIAPGTNPHTVERAGDSYRKHHHEGNARTPGLELLAEQVVMKGPRPVPITAPRSKTTKRLPAGNTSHRSVAHNPRAPHPGAPLSSSGYLCPPSAYMGHQQPYPPAHRVHHHVHPPPYEYSYSYMPPLIGSRAHVHTVPPSDRKHQVAAARPAVHKIKVVDPPQTYAYLPPADPVSALPALFADAPSTRKACKCGNSQCLKLYCECFHTGALCDSKLCRCKDCKNNEENNEPKGAREYAILKIMAKRPDAFHTKVKRRTGNWCKCRKSSCLKKYCECVAQNRKCSAVCKCTGCANRE